MFRKVLLSSAAARRHDRCGSRRRSASTKGEPAYPPPPPPPYSWTGFYIGANAGVSGLSSSQTYGEYGYGDYYTYNGLRR